MKVVNNYANMDDVSILYNIVKESGLQIPLKDYEEFKETVFLGQPLVIEDYLENVDQYNFVLQSHQDEHWKIKHDPDPALTVPNVKRQSTKFRPVLTDVGLCSAFNAELENKLFQDQAVAEFVEVFRTGLDTKNFTLENAALKEKSFIIDTQIRRNYPFVARAGPRAELARLVRTTKVSASDYNFMVNFL